MNFFKGLANKGLYGDDCITSNDCVSYQCDPISFKCSKIKMKYISIIIWIFCLI